MSETEKYVRPVHRGRKGTVLYLTEDERKKIRNFMEEKGYPSLCSCVAHIFREGLKHVVDKK